MDVGSPARPQRRLLSLVLCLGIFTSIFLAYYVNVSTTIDTMGGFSRFLNKITKSDEAPAQAPGQHHAPPVAYHAQQPQQPQMAQHGSGKRVVGYFVSIVLSVCPVH